MPGDTEDLINYPRSVEGVEVGLMFIEQPGGGTKVSFRAKSLDVSKTGRAIRRRRAQARLGARTNDPLPQTRDAVLAAVEEAFGGVNHDEAAKRFSLRDLPIPAKLVVTCFLLAVGGGYSAAMVQLHMQDSKSGEPMPTVHDVILKYTGKKWFENESDLPKRVSKLEQLIMGSTDPNALFGSSGSMGPAFFTKDQSQGPKNYRRLIQATPEKKAAIDAQREGERQVLGAWINSDEEYRRDAYHADRFVPPADRMPKAIDPDWKNGDGFKVKSLIETRCVGLPRQWRSTGGLFAGDVRADREVHDGSGRSVGRSGRRVGESRGAD